MTVKKRGGWPKGKPRKNPNDVSDVAQRLDTLAAVARKHSITKVRFGELEFQIQPQRFKPIVAVDNQAPSDTLRDEVAAEFEAAIAHLNDQDKARARAQRMATWSS